MTLMLKMTLMAGSILLVFTACSGGGQDEQVTGIGVSPQGTVLEPVVVDTLPPEEPITYSNAHFRDVRVITEGENRFRITGQAQVHEANLSWTLEDGHNILKEGFETTSAGAPDWGRFDFTVEARKQNEQSTLHLVLFGISADDGSRQHELPLLLY
jgi:hypothetical protein